MHFYSNFHKARDVFSKVAQKLIKPMSKESKSQTGHTALDIYAKRVKLNA